MNNNQMNNFNNNFSSSDINSNNTIDPNQNIQNDYYNNDAYYNNSNYETNNYSDTTYEEKEKKNGIWWKILLVILVLLIIIILLLKFCTGGKSNDEKYTELKKTICNAAEEYLNNNSTLLDRTTPGKTVIIKLSTLADANLIDAKIENPYYDGGLFKKATVEQYYSMNNSVRLTVLTDGTFGCELVDNANDVTAPVLRLNGNLEITYAVGTEFEDPGYTATDDYDGDITDKVVRSGTYDYSKAGVYEFTYTVEDSAGNVTSAKRKVIYEEYPDLEITLGSILDTVTPMISLKGSNPYCMVKGTQYVEPGAIATDNVDGNITDRMSVENKVTGNLMGAFRVVYKVEDSSGNQAIAYRAVIVTTECPEEKEPEKAVNNAPTITLIGKNSVTINKGTQYIDLGAIANDKEDGDITNKIITDTSRVNVNKAGIYTVTYKVTDSGGKTSSAIRTVTVKESVTGNPSVRFTSRTNNIRVQVGKGTNDLLKTPTAVNENGVAVAVKRRIEDAETGNSVNAINWNKIGKYRVIYTATHGNGILSQDAPAVIVTIYGASIDVADKVIVPERTENCNINEGDIIKGGVQIHTGNVDKEKIKVGVNGPEGMTCKAGIYEVTVKVDVGEGEPVDEKVTVEVVKTINQNAPGKVTITGNTLNTKDPYNKEGSWAGGKVTAIGITYSSTPVANTEISYFEWSSDCNNPKTADDVIIEKTGATTGLLRWKKEGANNICVRAVTTAGVAGAWSDPVKLNIDLTGPSIEFTHTWADGKEDWHNDANLTVKYAAKDNGSGISHFEYTFDDVKGKVGDKVTNPKTHEEASGQLTVNENTESGRKILFVYVRAVDKADNAGEWTLNPAFVNIDTVKPYAPTLSVEGNGTSVVKLNANFTDAPSIRPSGFGKLIYTVDGGSEQEESSKTITAPPNTTSSNVTQNIKVWAVDKAGNRSDLYAEETVTVAPPVTTYNLKSKILEDNDEKADNKSSKGLVYISNSKYLEGNNTIYYFKGNVTNNNVLFAGYCWKIIRTNDSGGIRMIYSGVPVNGTCDVPDSQRVLTKSVYNDSAADARYVGYMYGNSCNSYAECHENINDSTVKKYLDNWYSKNLSNYTKYMDLNAVYCNDRTSYTTIAFTNPGGGYGTTNGYFAGYLRSENYNNLPKYATLKCTNLNDQFSVNSGNKKLKYPIALITVDEVYMAGVDTRNYLYNSTGWMMTMSPGYYDKANGNWRIALEKYGSIRSHKLSIPWVVRPVISLTDKVVITEGNGEAKTPYVVYNYDNILK